MVVEQVKSPGFLYCVDIAADVEAVNYLIKFGVLRGVQICCDTCTVSSLSVDQCTNLVCNLGIGTSQHIAFLRQYFATITEDTVEIIDILLLLLTFARLRDHFEL